MNDDWLKRWQTLLHTFSGVGPAPNAQFDPYSAIAASFENAWRTALARASSGGLEESDAAIRQLTDFLRSRFADLAPFAAIGPQRLEQEQWQGMAEAVQRLQEAQADIVRLWSDALREAADAFARQCLHATQGTSAGANLYDTWIDCAEDAYSRMAHGEAFCSAQSRILNEQSRLRADLQAMLERFAKELDLPTRSEMNSVHRALRAIRAELAPKPKRASAPRPRTKRKPR